MTQLAAGSEAPRFDLPSRGGGEQAVPGDAPLTFLVIYKRACPTCRWALPLVQSLHEKVDGLRVLGVASDTEEDVESLASEMGLTFPIARESEPWPVSSAYGLQTVPTVFLIDGKGRILRSGAGFGREDFEEAARLAAERTGSAPVNPFPEGMTVPPFRPG